MNKQMRTAQRDSTFAGKLAVPGKMKYCRATLVGQTNCCAVRQPEALRAPKRKTSINMPFKPRSKTNHSVKLPSLFPFLVCLNWAIQNIQG